MPTVEVNGNLDGALSLFADKTQSEGIIKQYTMNQSFISPSEHRNFVNHKRKRKIEKRSKRRKNRQK